MGDDVLNEILGYLGFEEYGQVKKASRGRVTKTLPPELEPQDTQDEALLKRKGSLTLWRSRSGNTFWIELRGPEGTVRATRQKVKLLLEIESMLRSWTTGKKLSAKKAGLRIETVTRHNGAKLEIRYLTWKPIRLSRGQARGLLAFFPELKSFAAGKR
jgi:hypothetical protein